MQCLNPVCPARYKPQSTSTCLHVAPAALSDQIRICPSQAGDPVPPRPAWCWGLFTHLGTDAGDIA